MIQLCEESATGTLEEVLTRRVARCMTKSLVWQPTIDFLMNWRTDIIQGQLRILIIAEGSSNAASSDGWAKNLYPVGMRLLNGGHLRMLSKQWQRDLNISWSFWMISDVDVCVMARARARRTKLYTCENWSSFAARWTLCQRLRTLYLAADQRITKRQGKISNLLVGNAHLSRLPVVCSTIGTIHMNPDES